MGPEPLGPFKLGRGGCRDDMDRGGGLHEVALGQLGTQVIEGRELLVNAALDLVERGALHRRPEAPVDEDGVADPE